VTTKSITCCAVSLLERFSFFICSALMMMSSSGMKQSSKMISLAGQPFWPIFFSMRP